MLCYQDTDSFFYLLKTKDLYDDMKALSFHLYTYDYPKDHKLYYTLNKKVIGKFKNEMNDDILLEFAGLSSNTYAYTFMKDSVIKEGIKAKEDKSYIIKNNLRNYDYFTFLKNKLTIRKQQNIIRSHKHRILTESINKVALNGEDDKRVILSNGNPTFPYIIIN
ncbi:hypothetical protein B4U80_01021 [Leptotrombidium deliense]|uniref:DNA-directed DNA polymerase n=1 Tax=Leptotrombidium deliense TaxID=299467 RepID=A0A443RJL5_9ACAR|nr:hypothetical protein B4U80_01021 [Leptotrombidium deliense]